MGTDIIYTLCCLYNFKQEMLTTMVKDGLLEVCFMLALSNLDALSTRIVYMGNHTRSTKPVVSKL